MIFLFVISCGSNVTTDTSSPTEKKDPAPPSAVENLKVDSFSNGYVVLSWTAPTNTGTDDGITSAILSYYIVKYKVVEIETTNGEFAVIDENSKGVWLTEEVGTNTTATVTNLSPGTEYIFLVAAVNSGGVEGPEATIDAKIEIPLPDIPTGLSKTLTCNKTTSVDLKWEVSSGATYYKLYRDGVEIPGSIDTTNYTDPDLPLGTSYTYTVEACSAAGCSDASDPVTTISDKSFASILYSGKVPTELFGYDQRSREIFAYYQGGASLVVRYVKKEGSGDESGSSFVNASGDPKAIIDEISSNNATAGNVYVVLLGGGTYTPDTMNMKNYVAIVGGVDECLGSSDTATTLDGQGRVLFLNRDINNTALLYGVTITNGATGYGGGMFNNKASPRVTRVNFIGNSADKGGAMYNGNSSPILTMVTFSGNSADRGGAMYNKNSSPSLIGVTFSGNTATFSGGGMFNDGSSPIMIGVTFFGNKAAYGGAMYNNNGGQAGPLIVNSISWSNIATTSGLEFFFYNQDSAQEKLRIYNSTIEGGTGNLEDGTLHSSVNQGGFVSDGGAAAVVISFSNISDADPQLEEALTDNGGSVLTHAIPSTSPAVNQGLYVSKKDSKFYFNVDNTEWDNWYEKPDLKGGLKPLPTDAEDLTAIDARGFTRVGRPDLGAYEYGGTSP